MTNPRGRPSGPDRATALDRSIWRLANDAPELSGKRTFIPWQVTVLVATGALIVVCLVLWPVTTGIVLMCLASIMYLSNLIDRTWLFGLGVESSPEIRISAAEAMAIPDDELPTYTILVPAFNEPGVIVSLINNLGLIDYPSDRLDIKLLLEEDDLPTIRAVQAALADRALPADLVLVAASDPRTKPKACNFGLEYAAGEFVTIYDAEDIPEPLQVRRAVLAFRQLPDDVACIQAKLSYHNDRQNLLTRWFTSEYNQWFGYTLPGLMKVGAPIPLGGTSNHIRTDTLRQLGGWDPFNVTEDADLGIRLWRQGYRTAILDSVTLEEANSDTINWIRQRSRGYKGYLQTFLVHSRNPVQLKRQVGWFGLLRFASITLGPPVISLLNALFWSMFIMWEFGEPNFIRQIFPAYVFYPAIASLVFGNSAIIYCGLVAARVDRKPYLLVATLTIPIYWIMMSIAAGKAFLQLVFQPSYWEKTAHGLDSDA